MTVRCSPPPAQQGSQAPLEYEKAPPPCYRPNRSRRSLRVLHLRCDVEFQTLRVRNSRRRRGVRGEGLDCSARGRTGHSWRHTEGSYVPRSIASHRGSAKGLHPEVLRDVSQGVDRMAGRRAERNGRACLHSHWVHEPRNRRMDTGPGLWNTTDNRSVVGLGCAPPTIGLSLRARGTRRHEKLGTPREEQCRLETGGTACRP